MKNDLYGQYAQQADPSLSSNVDPSTTPNVAASATEESALTGNDVERERLADARSSRRLYHILLVLTFILMLIGTTVVIWAIFTENSIISVKAAAGLLIDAIGGILFPLVREARQDAQDRRKALDDIASIMRINEMITQMSDETEKNKWRGRLIDTLINRRL